MDKEVLKRLRVLRIYKGITQERLAEELNISRSKVSSWETGRRYISVDDAIILSEYFDISLDNLLNPRALNKEEYIKISEKFFTNSKLTFKEKEETLKKIREIFLISNSDEFYPLSQNDSRY